MQIKSLTRTSVETMADLGKNFRVHRQNFWVHGVANANFYACDLGVLPFIKRKFAPIIGVHTDDKYKKYKSLEAACKARFLA